MHRKIKGLKWARVLANRPNCIPAGGRARGAKALGLSYERALAKTLASTARHGQWFEFEDANGIGYCQPDFLLRNGDALVVLEAKYSWTIDGHRQIDELYRPVLEWLRPGRVDGVVVCKRLVPGMTATVFGDLGSAIREAASGRAAWHWLGKNTIGV